ncbi:hypothetical protein [Pedobacter heparinus]|uniref:hypothetical protein n=1 Tax=Pedobacter heparinus TaxID=984 RepID=UPI0029304B2E|nr:hypothetical protein [Pedobacter heparinus]
MQKKPFSSKSGICCEEQQRPGLVGEGIFVLSKEADYQSLLYCQIRVSSSKLIRVYATM